MHQQGRARLFKTHAHPTLASSAPQDVAALSMAQALGATPHPTHGPLTQAGAPLRFAGLRDRLMDVDWAPDLGRDIGTLTWWRGLATLTLLCGTAIASWPGLKPIPAHAATMLPDDWEQARAQTIMPLAWGGDTGRRMAATDAVQPLAAAPERPRIELTATLGQGDSFSRLLERSGVGGGEAARITAMVGNAVPIASITPGTRLDLVLGRRSVQSEPRPVESLAFRAALDLRLELVRNGGALSMERIRIAVDNTPLRIRGQVGESLYRSARAAGAPPSAIQSYLRIISGQLSVSRDVSATDTFDIIVAHRRAETGEVEVGDILYAGLSRGATPRLRMVPWTIEGREQWYEASGVGQQRAGLAMPVNGRLTSQFGMRRHPILGYTRMHAGQDYGAPFGSPIFAVTDGTVKYAGYKGGYGRYVNLDHGGGMGTGYGHMSRVAVAAGQHVRRGQVLGYVGSSGLSTGPHLHYELYRNGHPVNPASVTFTSRATLAGAQLNAFRARLAQLTAITPNAGMAAPVRATGVRSAGSTAMPTAMPTPARARIVPPRTAAQTR